MSRQWAAQATTSTTGAGAPANSGVLQRKCASCGDHMIDSGECETCSKKNRVAQLRRTSIHGGLTGEAPPIVNEVLRSPGQPLDATVREHYEPRFHHEFSKVRVSSTAPALAHSGLVIGDTADIHEREADRIADSIMHKDEVRGGASPANEPRFPQPDGRYDLSRVRVHTDTRAAESARAVNALAYTVGHDVVFGAGQYQPFKPEGQRLLAHELTHVAQQGAGSFSSAPAVQRQAVPAPAPRPAPAPAPPTGGLTDEMLRQIARILHEAMAGLGTDEEAIYSALSGRTQDQADAIDRVYREMYGVDLLSALQGELNESEMMNLAIYNPLAALGKPGSDPAATYADLAASQLNKAMDRLGTDEDSIYAALTGRTQDELKNIKDAYKQLTNRELEADIRDEMSGAELTRALRLLNQGVLEPEDEAYFAVKGLGTDEDTLLRVLDTVKGDRAKARDLIDKFSVKGYGNLLEWVNEELSGSDLDKALEALLGTTPTAACSTSQREDALEAVSLAAAMAQSALTRANTDLVSNKLSGTVESALSTYFNPGGAKNAVNLALLRQVRDAIDQTRTDLLSTSNVVCVTQNDGHCVTKPDCSDFVGAWTRTAAGGTVNICPGFFSCSNDRATNILHEFFHHMGMRDRGIYYGQSGYSSLTPIGDGSVNDSLGKADAYAHFAKDLY
jgi:uncharacterized protein DUF4157/annexin-like protein/lysine-specific metallo-endopeptidase family protein